MIIITNTGQIIDIKCLKASDRNQRQAETGGDKIPEGGWHGWTNIFIYPGYRFNVVDHLITNFHLPQSSLIMLVAALCGRKRILDAYAEAVEEKYRFFSYGDAMFVR